MRTSFLLTLLLACTSSLATTMADQTLAGATIGCTTQGVLPIRAHNGGIQFRVDPSADSYTTKSWTVEPGVAGSPIISRVQETTNATSIQFDASNGCTLRLSQGAVGNATDVSIDLPSRLSDGGRGTYLTSSGERKNLVCDFTLSSYKSLKQACLKAQSKKAPAKAAQPRAPSDAVTGE